MCLPNVARVPWCNLNINFIHTQITIHMVQKLTKNRLVCQLQCLGVNFLCLILPSMKF